jgi:DNA-binding IclR family transcriptional regulator
LPRLTDRQIAVLAAIERLGNPTLPELRGQFTSLAASEIYRVIEALERRGLVAKTGYSAIRFVAVRRGQGTGVPGSVPAGD